MTPIRRSCLHKSGIGGDRSKCRYGT